MVIHSLIYSSELVIVRQRSCGKVIFSDMCPSVCLVCSTGGRGRLTRCQHHGGDHYPCSLEKPSHQCSHLVATEAIRIPLESHQCSHLVATEAIRILLECFFNIYLSNIFKAILPILGLCKKLKKLCVISQNFWYKAKCFLTKSYYCVRAL